MITESFTQIETEQQDHVLYWSSEYCVTGQINIMVLVMENRTTRKRGDSTKIIYFFYREYKHKMKPPISFLGRYFNQNAHLFFQSSEDKLIELLQRDRKLHLDKFCKSRKTLNKSHLEYMIVNDKYKTIYCYVPKVACSQWNLVFLSLNNKTHVNNVHDPNHFHFLNQYSDEGINIRLKTYFKFFFVREPLERFLSAYENKFVQYKWPWNKILYFSKEMVENYRKFNNTATEDVDFTKFIFYLSGVGYDSNRHWASYESLCHPCDIEYDFIGHFEDMQLEAPFVLRKTGMDRVTSFPPFYSHNTSAKLLEKYADVPGYKIIELANRYQRDFELFNYSFPGPVAQLLKDLN